jgi:rhodanese-related sulfurtransferase
MDGSAHLVNSSTLCRALGTAAAPTLFDVRDPRTLGAEDRLIVGAIHRPAEHLAQWISALPLDRQVVVYCGDGRVASQGAAAALRQAGLNAAVLEGGFAGWMDRHLPTRRMSNISPNKWVTREHPKIDRVACPWLISRFINPNAEFIYVTPTDVLKVAENTGAIAFDIKDVEFGHVGDRCSFDAILRHYDIHDAALDDLAIIVRGADTSRRDLAPQCHGLLAISYGLSANFSDDHAMLRHGLVMYDALYTWCRMQRNRTGG